MEQMEMDEKRLCDFACQTDLPKRRVSVRRRLKLHFSSEVTTTHTDLLLLTCCLISGLVDSTVYQAYGTFVSMQTVLTAIPTQRNKVTLTDL